MNSATRQLDRWRRLLSVQTAQREELILRQRELKDKIADAEFRHKQLESAQRDTSRIFASATTTVDIALRSAVGFDLQARGDAIDSANGDIKVLQTEHENLAAEGAKIQRVISVIEARIEECQIQFRREAERRGS